MEMNSRVSLLLSCASPQPPIDCGSGRLDHPTLAVFDSHNSDPTTWDRRYFRNIQQEVQSKSAPTVWSICFIQTYVEFAGRVMILCTSLLFGLHTTRIIENKIV
jgi:hypothetical protein